MQKTTNFLWTNVNNGLLHNWILFIFIWREVLILGHADIVALYL